MKVLDLFSGIGAFSLGLERAGMETIAFVEIDPFCRAVLRKHWPHVRQYEDIRDLTAERLGADGIVPDVICGGFPCQDISLAGKNAGIDGDRSGLWADYARIIGAIRPRYVIVENVSALLGRGIERVLGDLAAFGYDAEWHCIPASAIGAPHIRDRVWIVAYADDKRSSRQGPIVGLGNMRTTRWPQWEQIGLQICDNFRGILAGCPASPKPLIRRGDDGFDNWSHRISALGNAVVPQIPEAIGRAILADQARMIAP